MDSSQISEHIFDLFHECCLDMFTDLQCSIELATGPDEHVAEAPISDIDASCDDLELRVLLRFPYAVLAMTYPVDEVLDVDDSKLEDWLAEISNQLIGRLKNKLINNQIYLCLGLPENHFGVQPEQLEPEGFERKVLYYDIDNETIECHVLVDVINPNLELTDASQRGDDEVDEGELELF